MYSQAQLSYASQAEQWKKKGASAWKSNSSSSSNAVSELVLISELCSSVGQSSFPPRETLNTLLRQINSMDHAYICELLEKKLEDRLWQVVARALAVLDALFNTNAAETYLEYFSSKINLLHYLTQHSTQTVKSRAETVVVTLESYEPKGYFEPNGPQNQSYESYDQGSYQAPIQATSGFQLNDSYHSQAMPTRQRNFSNASSTKSNSNYQSPVHAPTQPANAFTTDLLLGSPRAYDSSQSGSSLFDSLTQRQNYQSQPSENQSAFSFLSQTPSQPPAEAQQSSFDFLMAAPSPVSSSSFSNSNEEPSPVQSSSAFSFVQGSTTSSFDFLQQSTQPTDNFVHHSHERSSLTSLPRQSPKAADRIHDAFADLSVDDSPDFNVSDFGSASQDRDDESEQSMDPPTPPKSVSARDEFENMKKAGMAREVILEVEIPPGPMGIILDRTIPTSAVIAKYAPLANGEKGYIELHPAICPGCLLVAINGNSIEHLALAELGPVLASSSMYHRVLTFKKFMVGSRVMHPELLRVQYTPPPPEDAAPRPVANTPLLPTHTLPTNPPHHGLSAATDNHLQHPSTPKSRSRVSSTASPSYKTLSPSVRSTPPPTQSSGFGFLQTGPTSSPHLASQPQQQHSTGFSFLQGGPTQSPRSSTQQSTGFGFLQSGPAHSPRSRSMSQQSTGFGFLQSGAPSSPRSPARSHQSTGFGFLQSGSTNSPRSPPKPHQSTGFSFLESGGPRHSPRSTSQPSTGFSFLQQQQPPAPQSNSASSFSFLQQAPATSPRREEPPKSAFSFI